MFETVQFPHKFVTDEAVHALLPLVRRHDVGFIARCPYRLPNRAMLQEDVAFYDHVAHDRPAAP